MKTGYDEMVEAECKLLQKILLRQGEHRFGPPSAEVESAIRAIDDFDRLEAMIEVILSAKDWQQLLTAKRFLTLKYEYSFDSSN